MMVRVDAMKASPGKLLEARELLKQIAAHHNDNLAPPSPVNAFKASSGEMNTLLLTSRFEDAAAMESYLKKAYADDRLREIVQAGRDLVCDWRVQIYRDL